MNFTKEQLELMSDMVRKGYPISLPETLAVIEYQRKLQQEREVKSLVRHCLDFIIAFTKGKQP